LNSAIVTGLEPAGTVEHSILPEPQSPVMQENLPVSSSVQFVRPHKRPAQSSEVVISFPAFSPREKPVGIVGAT